MYVQLQKIGSHTAIQLINTEYSRLSNWYHRQARACVSQLILPMHFTSTYVSFSTPGVSSAAAVHQLRIRALMQRPKKTSAPRARCSNEARRAVSRSQRVRRRTVASLSRLRSEAPWRASPASPTERAAGGGAKDLAAAAPAQRRIETRACAFIGVRRARLYICTRERMHGR